eukprot:Em0005g1008a
MESLAHSAELGLELDDSGKRSYSLLRDMLPPLETLVVTVQGSDGSDGVSSNSQHGSKIDDVSSRHARRKICEVEESAREALEFLPSYGLIAESLKVHTSAGKSISIALSPDAEGVNTPDSCSNLRVLYLLDKFGECHGIKKARIELNRSMTLHRIDGFEGAYRPFEEILCEQISRMISDDSTVFAPNRKITHGSMKQFSCQGVEKHNDDAKRNYFSSNQWDAPAEDRVQAGRAA